MVLDHLVQLYDLRKTFLLVLLACTPQFNLRCQE